LITLVLYKLPLKFKPHACSYRNSEIDLASSDTSGLGKGFKKVLRMMIETKRVRVDCLFLGQVSRFSIPEDGSAVSTMLYATVFKEL